VTSPADDHGTDSAALGLDPDRFRTLVDEELDAFVVHQRLRLAPLGERAGEYVDAAARFVEGGKRLRPLFCLAGWVAAGGDPADARLVRAAASLEWLQGSALAHDDVMDDSDTRRGRPSLHREFAARHRADGRVGDPDVYGRAVAILLGDLMLSWCDEMLRDCGLDVTAAGAVLDECKTEVVAGQLLDVAGQTVPSLSVEEALRVVRYKSAKYSVERPLHLGAALAGGDAALTEVLSAVGLPLGEAFQLRDDVLGVFGDPAETGKPAGDDLREGKRTVLVARAAERLSPADRQRLHEGLGHAEHVPALSAMLRESGALDAVEADIDERVAAARAAMADVDEPARTLLGDLLDRATRRTR
jgi:geranylgeranyl diphosphate synthase type I